MMKNSSRSDFRHEDARLPLLNGAAIDVAPFIAISEGELRSIRLRDLVAFQEHVCRRYTTVCIVIPSGSGFLICDQRKCEHLNVGVDSDMSVLSVPVAILVDPEPGPPRFRDRRKPKPAFTAGCCPGTKLFSTFL